MDLNQLANEMRVSPISLFYGAGVGATCGGPTWDQLFTAIKERFSEGKSSDFFSYMQEKIKFDNSNRAEIEDFIRKQLAQVVPEQSHKYLFSIPWRAVLTTNFDSLPELIDATIDESRKIVPIANPNEPIDQRREDHLYCFKLLGDARYSYPQAGYMTLSTSDLFSVSAQRQRFFEKFRNLATSGHIIYLGYSFNDEIVFLLLSQMKSVSGQFPWKGYAIIPSEPNAETMQKLKEVGIEWVKGTLEEFVQALKPVFGEAPQSSPVGIGYISIHNQSLILDRSVLANIWNKYTILNDDLLAESGIAESQDFFRGICNSFHPYVARYDYPRKTKVVYMKPKTKTIVPPMFSAFALRHNIEELDNNGFFALTGIAGSGKTVVANRLAFEWYHTGNPVVFLNSQSTSVDEEALDSIMNEIRDKYLTKSTKAGIDKPAPLRWLIIADDCVSVLPELKTLRNHMLATGRPADIVLVTRETETPVEKLKSFDIDAIYKLDDTIIQSEREEFLSFFKRFDFMDQYILEKNLQNYEINSSFFALIYTSVSHSRKTIDRLLEDEYNKLDRDSQRIYRFVSLMQSYRADPLVSLLIKSSGVDAGWLLSQVKKGSLSGVLQTGTYGRSLNTPNRLVAEIICKTTFRTSDERKTGLSSIISTATIEDIAEMEFLDNLLNGSVEGDFGPKFSIKQKIDLFKSATKVAKSKPLLIHLGRLETEDQRFDDARKTFKEAYGAHLEHFDERIEHVKDAEARLDFEIAEAYIAKGRDYYDKAWEYLDAAEEKFIEAKINPQITPHPYEGLGRTYVTKAKIAKEEKICWEFLLLAMSECNYVEKNRGEIPEIFVLKKEIGNMLDQVGFNESQVEKIGSRIGQANGYAYLAEKEILHGNSSRALAIVEKGLKIEYSNLWLMRLKVSLLRVHYPDKHSEILDVLDDYEPQMNEKYDIELSFELAKEMFMQGRIIESRRYFRELFSKAQNHPRRIVPREPEDRWIENGTARRLTGTIINMPTEDRYGFIQITSPVYRTTIIVRKKDLQYKNPNAGDRVTLEIVFNMLGPEASRVRSI